MRSKVFPNGMADHPHIFVSRKGRNSPYRGITPNIQVVRVQRENRRAHTEELAQAVEAAVERNAEQVLLPEEERGFYLSEELAFEHLFGLHSLWVRTGSKRRRLRKLAPLPTRQFSRHKAQAWSGQ